MLSVNGEKAERWAGGALEIDLDAIADNYRFIQSRLRPGTQAAAAVKADAYGLAASRVAPVLERAGCRHFFVAHLSEGAVLRPLLDPTTPIFVLHGPPPGTAADLYGLGLVPVLNSMEQITEWQSLAAEKGRALPAVLQLDSGMARFGLEPATVEHIAQAPECLAGIDIRLVMSHLACADVPDHPANQTQLENFRRLKALLPAAPASLAASSGIFLGQDWHFDLVRSGAALYGINPVPGQPNPLKPVVRLQARIIQTRDVAEGQSVGYGANFVARRASRIALLGIGYGDGFLRQGGGHGHAVWPERPEVRLPIIGRVSMDSLAVDITDLQTPQDQPALLAAGTKLDLIGPHNTLEDAAEAAGTIGYELLTDLGGRYHRHYKNNA